MGTGKQRPGAGSAHGYVPGAIREECQRFGYLCFGFALVAGRRVAFSRGAAVRVPGVPEPRFFVLVLIVARGKPAALLSTEIFGVFPGLDFVGVADGTTTGLAACNFGTAWPLPRGATRVRLGD